MGTTAQAILCKKYSTKGKTGHKPCERLVDNNAFQFSLLSVSFHKLMKGEKKKKKF